jgi:hypothetical protein
MSTSSKATSVVDCHAVICDFEASVRDFREAEARHYWWQKPLPPIPTPTPIVQMCMRRVERRSALHHAELVKNGCYAMSNKSGFRDFGAELWLCWTKYQDPYADDGVDDYAIPKK